MKRGLWAALCVFGALAGAGRAAAQIGGAYDDTLPPNRGYISPERFTIEIHVGPYQPSMNGNDAFRTFFNSDIGPLIAVELDVIGYRLTDILYLSGAGGVGTASFKGKTIDDLGARTSEETTLSLKPLDLMAVLRVDALPRKLSVPLIVTGKLGYEWAHWSTDSGGGDDHSGWSVGLLWAVQLALDLDTFDRRAARTMDEEWGINHSFVFIEFFGFEPTHASLPIGDHSWSAGLGFVF